MSRVILEVIFDLDAKNITPLVKDKLAENYYPTSEAPEPDDEWYVEELALVRIGELAGCEYVTVTDVEHTRIFLGVVKDESSG